MTSSISVDSLSPSQSVTSSLYSFFPFLSSSTSLPFGLYHYPRAPSRHVFPFAFISFSLLFSSSSSLSSSITFPFLSPYSFHRPIISPFFFPLYFPFAFLHLLCFFFSTDYFCRNSHGKFSVRIPATLISSERTRFIGAAVCLFKKIEDNFLSSCLCFVSLIYFLFRLFLIVRIVWYFVLFV